MCVLCVHACIVCVGLCECVCVCMCACACDIDIIVLVTKLFTVQTMHLCISCLRPRRPLYDQPRDVHDCVYALVSPCMYLCVCICVYVSLCM